jgi:hypothetical protein
MGWKWSPVQRRRHKSAVFVKRVLVICSRLPFLCSPVVLHNLGSARTAARTRTVATCTRSVEFRSTSNLDQIYLFTFTFTFAYSFPSCCTLVVLLIMTGPESERQALPLEPEFIDDVGTYLQEHVTDSVDAVLDSMRQKLQLYGLAENRALARRQKLLQQQVHLRKSIDCVKMLREKSQSQSEATVDYSLGGELPAQSVDLVLLPRRSSSSYQTRAEYDFGLQRTSSRKLACPQQRPSVSGLA